MKPNIALQSTCTMEKEFTGKVVLITGASSGIGAGTAKLFSTLGASLALTGRNKENLEKTKKECIQEGSPEPLLIQADITIEDDITRIIESTIERFGRLDVLVNNAGVAQFGNLEKSNLHLLDEMLKTNVCSVFQLTKLAVPHLLATKGNIVNVSSISGLRPFSLTLTYCMAKKALDQFTQCTALELAPKQVRVNSVNPGVVVTEIFSKMGHSKEQVEAFLEKAKESHPIGRVGRVEDVANAIVFLASERAAFITGVRLPIDGGRNLLCPR